MVHLEPFQSSTRVTIVNGDGLDESPTAMHLLDAGHATPLSALSVNPGLVGAFTIVHFWVWPFQCSMSGTSLLSEVEADPTATQSSAVVHVTLLNWLDEPFGFGVTWMRQDDPFQRSASGTVPPDPLGASPTAMHE